MVICFFRQVFIISYSLFTFFCIKIRSAYFQRISFCSIFFVNDHNLQSMLSIYPTTVMYNFIFVNFKNNLDLNIWMYMIYLISIFYYYFSTSIIFWFKFNLRFLNVYLFKNIDMLTSNKFYFLKLPFFFIMYCQLLIFN